MKTLEYYGSDTIIGVKHKLVTCNLEKLFNIADKVDECDKRWLSYEETSTYLGIPVGSLRNQKSAGCLPFSIIFGKVRFDRRELDELLESSKQGVFNDN